MLETFGWIAYRVTVAHSKGCWPRGKLRVAADGRIRPRTKWPSERIGPMMCSTFS
jgi:hypothetical protein